jgi:radical SAM protein with 4Fe4S-binding SPASM domain
MEYYIFVTNNCNLSCRYCSGIGIKRSENIIDQPTYSFDILKKFIVMTQSKYKSDTIDIIFFGGEPTLNYGYIKSFIKYFGREIGDNRINYALHTNGLLLNEADDELLRNLNLIIISINYEMIPKFKLHGSYFAGIIDNIKHVRHLYPVKIMARLTITDRVSLYTNLMQVSSFFDYVYWQIQQCDNFSNYELFFNNYKYDLNLSLEYWFNLFKRGFFINFVPFVSSIKLLQEPQNSILCGFNTSSININTDGKCYSCPDSINDERFLLGDVFTEISFPSIDAGQTKCKDCGYYINCYGRCGRMHILYSTEHTNEYCKLNQEMFKFFVNNKEEISNIIAKYPQYSAMINDPNNYIYSEYIP